MNYSIQQFQEKGIEKIENLIQMFIQNPHKMAEFIGGIKDEVIRLGLDIIKETFDECDEMLRKSKRRFSYSKFTPSRKSFWVDFLYAK